MQRRVFDFLMNPEVHGGASVQRIDTHGAAVFLAGPRALKIKRAVKFPYLDYSTLSKRREACEQELLVNRAFAPQIYRGLAAIRRRADGRFAIGGDGEVVEWALEMARFDERQTVDHLARAGALGIDLLHDIADVIATSHRNAPIAATAPWVESIDRIINGNSAAFRAGGFPSNAIDALDANSHVAFARARDLLDRRGAKGYVRRCHGDLHLENIVVINGKPVLFDAIEFNPSFASTDVLYDLGFALMDFLHYGRPDAANVVMNRYLAITDGDHLDALSALPLLLSMRAAIRGNVMLSRPFRDDAQRLAIRAEAEAYFALAVQLIAPPPPRLIAIGGLSGTGKSALARALAADIAPLPGAVVLRSDVARKRQFGVGDTERLPAEAYQPEVTAAIYAELGDRAGHILAQGHSVVVDAVFARPQERDAIAAVAAAREAPFRGLFLSADLATRIARIERRSHDASDATTEIATAQQGYDIGPIDWLIVDASGTPQQTLDRARAAIGEA
uniref:Aminoglycoside phosphotransferase domain-containing protein n=1 Tax=Rhodopseudomonas palustris (strain BisA53) TaxID=316055 RepID=Q07QV3_RHOP5